MTQLNGKPIEASTYFETGRRKFANIRVSKLKAERAKLKVLKRIVTITLPS